MTSLGADVDCGARLVTVRAIQTVDARQDTILRIACERAYVENGCAHRESQAVGGERIGLESGELPLQAGAAVTESGKHGQDGAAPGIESPPRQSLADLIGEVGRLEHNGLAVDIA